VAYLICTDANRMCYVSMDPNRPRWQSETTPTAEEATSGIMGFGAYCAVVEVHAKEGFVVHHVEVARVPNVVGRNRKRWFTFEGADRLTLRVDATELVQPVGENTLIWERVQK
jgi:Lipocalin-like domain